MVVITLDNIKFAKAGKFVSHSLRTTLVLTISSCIAAQAEQLGLSSSIATVLHVKLMHMHVYSED